MVGHKSDLILIPSNNEHSSSNTRTVKGLIKAIIKTAKQYSRIINQIRNDPIPDSRKIFRTKRLNEVVNLDIRKLY